LPVEDLALAQLRVLDPEAPSRPPVAQDERLLAVLAAGLLQHQPALPQDEQGQHVAQAELARVRRPLQALEALAEGVLVQVQPAFLALRRDAPAPEAE